MNWLTIRSFGLSWRVLRRQRLPVQSATPVVRAVWAVARWPWTRCAPLPPRCRPAPPAVQPQRFHSGRARHRRGRPAARPRASGIVVQRVWPWRTGLSPSRSRRLPLPSACRSSRQGALATGANSSGLCIGRLWRADRNGVPVLSRGRYRCVAPGTSAREARYRYHGERRRPVGAGARSRYAEAVEKSREAWPSFLSMDALSDPLVTAAAEDDVSFHLCGQVCRAEPGMTAPDLVQRLISETAGVFAKLQGFAEG